jgi:phosphate transport system protein
MGELAHKTIASSLNEYIEDSNVHSEIQNMSDILVSMADEAEDKVFEIITRFQPVASDLRILKSYMKIAYDFTRYGRYALDISQIHEKLGGLRGCEDWIKDAVENMSVQVSDMVQTSVISLKNHDTQLARTLSVTEKQVDESYLKYLDRLVNEAPSTNRCTISSLLVVRYLERIADHATYIGESIVYLSTGERVTLR